MEKEIIKENKELILFENKKIRRQKYKDEWFYSIVDIIEILTNSTRARKYWDDLKKKIENEEKIQLSEKIGQLKMVAKDGKMRNTDCANIIFTSTKKVSSTLTRGTHKSSLLGIH